MEAAFPAQQRSSGTPSMHGLGSWGLVLLDQGSADRRPHAVQVAAAGLTARPPASYKLARPQAASLLAPAKKREEQDEVILRQVTRLQHSLMQQIESHLAAPWPWPLERYEAADPEAKRSRRQGHAARAAAPAGLGRGAGGADGAGPRPGGRRADPTGLEAVSAEGGGQGEGGS